MRELLSLRAYARHRDVNLSAVQKAIASGRISTVPDNKGRPRIDPTVADIQWAQNTNSSQQERASLAQFERTQADLAGASELPLGSEKSGVQTSVLANEKAETETVRRNLLELQLAQKRGELVRVDDIQRALANKLKAAQEHLSGLADRLAPILAAETDVKKVDEILRAEIHRAMTQIALEAPATTQ